MSGLFRDDDDDDDEKLFREAMAGVEPLRGKEPARPKQPAKPAPRLRPAAAPSPSFTLEDGGGRAPGVTRRQLSALRRGEPPIERRLDLHRMKAAEARRAIDRAVDDAVSAGARCLLVIHGKGKHSAGEPVLREVVVAALSTGPAARAVRAFCPARPRDGGEGATLVLLARHEADGGAATIERFVHRLTAADEDIDELGHVSNLVYLRWVLDAAKAHSRAVGWDHDAYRQLGSVWVVRSHEISYLRPALAGQHLEIATWVESWKRASCVRRTEIAGPGGEPGFARAATTWALVSLESGRPVRIPERLRKRFESAG